MLGILVGRSKLQFASVFVVLAASLEVTGCSTRPSHPYQASADRTNAYIQKHNQMTPEQKAAWFEQQVKKGNVTMPTNFKVMPNGEAVPLRKLEQTAPTIANAQRPPVPKQTSRNIAPTGMSMEEQIYWEQQRRQQERQLQQSLQMQRQRDLSLGIGYDPSR